MTSKRPLTYRRAIAASGMSIYSRIEIGEPDYWIPTLALESLLNTAMWGLSLAGLPLRTRSKVIKSEVCTALGYPVPESFTKTQPRFPGQQLDVYAQKSSNLQIWNEEIAAARRYAIIQVQENDCVGRIRVVNGQQLALLDTTGTITRKYQAGLDRRGETHELISALDTAALREHVQRAAMAHAAASPIDEPASGQLLPITEIFTKLSPLVGQSFADPGIDQERNRGAALHRLVCEQLGYRQYQDKGQFPDVRHQLLEVKLQTSPTIDLGVVLPSSTERLDIVQLGAYHPQHCDTRYALFYAESNGVSVTLTHLFVCNGADFFTRFRRFEGRVSNGKIQLPLPRGFFDG